jgi:glycosyltransferase involved in cell wall biosynthesis
MKRGLAFPNISIAMATYNGERYIAAQLESLAIQTILPNDLVVVDDGSTDKTVEIVKKFAKDSPFQIVLIENGTTLGVMRNFMKAASYCSGELVAFCDQDDVWHKDKVAKLGEVFLDPEVTLAAHSALTVDQNLNALEAQGVILKPARRPNVPIDLFLHLYGFTMIARRGIIEAANDILSSLKTVEIIRLIHHDRWINHLASGLGVSVLSPVQLALYRRHDQTVTHHVPKERIVTQLGMAISCKENYLYTEFLASCFLQMSARPELSYYKKYALASHRFCTETSLHYSLRSNFYRSENSFAKAYILMELILTRAYRRRRNGGFGLRSCLRDLSHLLGFGSVNWLNIKTILGGH